MAGNVLLINAPAARIKERHYEEPDMPRIGLAYLASYLLKSGIKCDCLDGKYEKLNFDGVLDAVGRHKPGIIGFTAMTTEIIDTAKLASKIKEKYPDTRIIIGGPHASALPGRTLEEFPVFDVACSGEGEHTLKELVETLEDREQRTENRLRQIKGIAYRDKDGVVKVNGPRPFVENLDELPKPDWQMFSPAKKYPILGSRGCPFRCNFCMRVLGGHIRFRDPYLVVKEMEEIYEKYKPGLFEFYDETFGVNKEKTHKLLDNIIGGGLHKKVKWHIQTRVDVVNQGLLNRMKEAGCDWVGFGVESGNDDILKATNKSITREKARNAVMMAKRARLATGSFFILGHPNETEKSMKDTVDFALELNTTTVSFGIMTPYPGTEIAKMAEEGKGGYRLLSKKWSDYNKQTSDVLELEGVTSDALQKHQLMAYMKFYLLRFNFSKIKSLLEFVDLKSIIKIFLERIFRK